jgi:hypothetical protein
VKKSDASQGQAAGMIAEFVDHYHRGRNHQGIENELIEDASPEGRVGRVHRRQRLGGLLNYYARAA